MSKISSLLNPLIVTFFSSFLISNPIRANEVTYELTNGDTISGVLIEKKSDEEIKVINNPIFGIIKINSSNIISDDSTTNEIEYEDTFLDMEDQSGKRWNSTIGINSSSLINDYNSDSFDINHSTSYESPKNQLNISTSYMKSHYSSEYYSNTNERGSLNIENHHSLTERTSLYTGFVYQYDSGHDVGQDEYLASLGIGYKLLNNPDYTLTITPAVSSHLFDDGSQCMIYSCGDLHYASTLKAELEWNLNQNMNLNVDNTYAVANGSEDFTINNFKTELKYYPDPTKSKLHASIGYSIIYHQITDPTPDKNLRLGMGIDF